MLVLVGTGLLLLTSDLGVVASLTLEVSHHLQLLYNTVFSSTCVDIGRSVF